MSDISYYPLIKGMTWSYSRLKAFESCKHYWFLRYIRQVKELDTFYTTYGSFMHEILEGFYSGRVKKEHMLAEFFLNFSKRVRGQRPSSKIVAKYIRAGQEYLSSFEPLKMRPLWVEKKLSFDLDGHPFVGIVDFLGESDTDGLCLVDNKSRDLKPRSKRAKPTAKDAELDDMLRQLYLYSIPVQEEFGKYPDYLCFNCFKTGVFIKEPFREERFEEAKRWALDMIVKVEAEEEFEPTQDYFFCRWLCGVSDKCVYDIESREERR